MSELHARRVALPGMRGDAAVPLSQLDVLVVDCQATAAAPRGHLLELGWARTGATGALPHAVLIRLPRGERVPPAVTRVTGITEAMVRGGVAARAAWSALRDEALSLGQQPAPAVAHFVRFEEPFLRSLSGGPLPLDLVCTHAMATRLLPGLPRRSLRALAGYFGRGVGALRRSAGHVEATAFVWRELVRLLEAEGVSTWGALHDWLGEERVGEGEHARRAWPMPRDVRLSLPDAPGLYRLQRTSGDVLYVGKAASLHHRVNSYFRKRHGVHERTLEMLSQARSLSFEVTPSALEAALLEPDEIKRHRPPYNVALAADDRQVWFTAPTLGGRSPRPSRRCRVGPFPSAEMLDQFAALARADRAALGTGRLAPDAATFNAGYARLCATHPELSRVTLDARARLLQLGTRLWHEGRRDRDADGDETAGRDQPAPAWTPESVQQSLERLALRAALAVRRARWLTRLVDVAVVWSEPGADGARLLIVEGGEIVVRGAVSPGATPPIPPGHRRTVAARQERFTLARLDRLRVLTTELKRLSGEGAPVALRFGARPALAGARLARSLSWV